LYIATPGRERGPCDAQLLVGALLQALVLTDLRAHRLEGSRRARVLGDRRVDLRVEPGDLRCQGARLDAVFLELPGPGRSRRAAGEGGRERHAERHQDAEGQTA